MPKVTITFNLPEEKEEYKITTDAGKLAAIVYEFTRVCRNKTKYSDGKLVSWEDVSKEWWNTLNEENYDPYQ